MRFHHFARTLGALFVLGLFGVLAGCGSGGPARAVVKGKVSIEGQNLTTGNVMFWGENNATASAAIDKHGNYVMNDAPVGDVKITVYVPNVNPAELAKMNAMKKGMPNLKSVDPSGSGMSISIMGDMPENIVPIPDKYATPESSGLTYTVQRGEQTKYLALTR